MSQFEQAVTGEFEVPYSVGHEKVAGPFLEGLKETAKKVIPTAGAAIAAGILTETAVRGYEGVVSAVSKGRAFQKLLGAAPDLKEIPATKLKEQFNVLYKFSPDVAKSPQVAASWIRQINTATLEGREYIPPDAIRDLVTIQKEVAGMRRSGLSRALSESVVKGFLDPKGLGKSSPKTQATNQPAVASRT